MGRHRPKEPSLTKLQLMLAFSPRLHRPWTTLWSAPQLPPIVVDPSASILQKGTQHLEQAVYVSNSSLDVLQVAETLDTLMPVITVLASFITTPLQRDSVNLRRAAEVTLETTCGRRDCHVDLDDLVSHEEDLQYRGHRPVAASPTGPCSSWTSLNTYSGRSATEGHRDVGPLSQQREGGQCRHQTGR